MKHMYQTPMVESLGIQPQAKILFASEDTPEPGKTAAPARVPGATTKTA